MARVAAYANELGAIMPLIPCPECDNEISEHAISCPKCGFPIKDPNIKDVPSTVKCLDCNNEIPLQVELCPHCGLFNSQKYQNKRAAMVWDSEDNTFISVACPSCSKESKIRKTSATGTRIGYKLNGEGTCSCGLVFDRIEKANEVSSQRTFVANQQSRRSTAGLLALLLGGLGIHHFYLGRPVAGICNLLFCWTFIPALLAIVTAIQYFSMTDEKFNRTVDKTHPNFKVA